ncbi:GNAT family acetyltransferase [Colletotrichum truncatum]|uniref:GNAT family acetyltransferase n=1 Tax=Colletotrichum truncatum TaxID=5467 RepID=A0ACC3Z2G0_COLTU|nr:GNAT family acetyltransferase [Colletotrichum truncatum]KAF6780841.1 GNAT family acetyltransferase [Colletotrichum truncatum]
MSSKVQVLGGASTSKGDFACLPFFSHNSNPAVPANTELGPIVSTLPAAEPDRSIVLHGSLATLEPWSASTHWASFWRNLQLLENQWLVDYFPFEEVRSEVDLRKQLDNLVAVPDVILYAVLANPAHLNPMKAASGEKGSAGHAEVFGFMAYSLAGTTHREIEVGAMFAPALQRTAAATEAHYVMLKNVLEPVRVQEGKSLPYRRVSWKCNSLNTASRRAAERLGYVYEGTLRNHQIIKGRSRDTSWFSIIDKEWPIIRIALEKWLDSCNFDEKGRQVKALDYIRAKLTTTAK